MRYRYSMAVALLAGAAPLHTPAQNAATPADSIIIRCADCGVIQSVRETQPPRGPSVPNVGGNEPIGLVAYIPIGRSSTGESSSYVGAVGTRDWQNLTTRTSYEFSVRMDDGDMRLVRREGVSDLQPGDRVRVVGNGIERMYR